MRSDRDRPANTGQVTFVILTIWLILFVIGAPPVLATLAFSLAPLPPIDRLLIALIYSYFALLLISFVIRKRYPGLVWLPGVVLAAIVVALQFGG
jgi:hypothetical protein